MSNSKGSFPGLLVSIVKCAFLHSMLPTRKLSIDVWFSPGAAPLDSRTACPACGFGGISISRPVNCTNEILMGSPGL